MPATLIDDTTLVDAANKASVTVTLGTDTLAGLTLAPGPLRLAALPQAGDITNLGSASIRRFNQSLGQGMDYNPYDRLEDEWRPW